MGRDELESSMIREGSTMGSFPRPTAPETTRVAVLADLHLSTMEEGTWKVYHRTADRLRAAVRALNGQDLDAVVFLGDLTKDGAIADHRAVQRILADLDHPVFAVPGNHDLELAGTDSPALSLGGFKDRYAPGHLPFHRSVGGVDLFALNSHASTDEAPAESWVGHVSADTLDWLDTHLEEADHPLVAVHHTLPRTMEWYDRQQARLPVSSNPPIFENGAELAALLRSHDVSLVLTAHLHFPAVIDSDGLNEVTVPPLGSFPSAYTIVEIAPGGTTITHHPVVDLAGHVESLGYGRESPRVLLAAAQLSRYPLVTDEADPRVEARPSDRK